MCLFYLGSPVIFSNLLTVNTTGHGRWHPAEISPQTSPGSEICFDLFCWFSRRFIYFQSVLLETPLCSSNWSDILIDRPQPASFRVKTTFFFYSTDKTKSFGLIWINVYSLEVSHMENSHQESLESHAACNCFFY